jgi:hypothetical protein
MKILLGLFLLLSAIGCVGQTKTAPSQKSKQIANYLAAIEAEKKLQFCSQPQILSHPDCDGRDYAQELNNLYKELLSDEIGTQLLFAKILTDYQKLRASAQTAPQVSQAAAESSAKAQMVLMLQNQRIIELLEQLLKKK